MDLKKPLLALIFASACGSFSLPAVSHVIVDFAPPPDRYERHPQRHRHGYVWERGHWTWTGHRYVWVPGHWVRVRHGHRHVAPRWVERDGRWEYHTRRWDRDGDGVPNRYDRRPDNPYRS